MLLLAENLGNTLGLSLIETSNSSSKTRGAAAPRTRITCTSFLGLEEPSLKLLRSSELQRTNSSPISNCLRSKSAVFISRNINYNINSLLLLRVGIRIIYIYISDERYIPEVEMKTKKINFDRHALMFVFFITSWKFLYIVFISTSGMLRPSDIYIYIYIYNMCFYA